MICPKCGLPKELCVCEEITREGQRIRVFTDRRRYGKYVTVIEGFEDVDLHKIAKALKSKLACGGTHKDNRVELQGDHTARVSEVLAELGFSRDMIDIV
jgi:translation initiation factor 1